ncbi:MAG: hypothetical protein NVSMB65_10010 [Chloroflexota bacterium]
MMDTRRTHSARLRWLDAEWSHYVLALAGVVLVTLLRWWMASLAPPSQQIYLYLVIVLLASYNGGVGPGIAAAILSVLAIDTLAAMTTGVGDVISRPDDLLDLAIFLLVATTVGFLAAREARQAQRADRRAAEVDAILQSMADAVLVVSPAGAVVQINTAALHLFGLDSVEDGLIPLDDYAARFGLRHLGEEMSESSGPLMPALTGHLFREEQYLLAGPGRSRAFLSLSGAPLLDAAGTATGFVIVAHDITALKEAEQQRDEFLALTTHELKTPVTSLKGYAQLAARMMERGQPAQATASLLRLQDSAERLAALVERLVEFARLSYAPPDIVRQELDLLEVLQSVVATMSTIATAHHLRILAPDEDPLTYHGDARRLEQALGHLVRNAICYSPPGTTVHLTAARDGDAAHITVRDEGIGVPEGEEERVFQPFVRGSNADTAHAGGLGVGLYMARRVVERHGGRLWLESPRGQGTAAHITLPLCQSRAA